MIMSINSKSTKAEILAAYKDLEKQKKALESTVKQAQNKPAASASAIAPTKSVPPKVSQNTNRDLSTTIDSLEQIQDGFGSAVSNLSKQLITEATELAAVKMAIATETADLENLHQLTDIDESTIDFLLDRYRASTQKFTEEYDRQQENSDREIDVLKQGWLKEQQVHHKSIIERDEDYRKSQQRDEEEYQYNLDLARDLDESEYAQQQKIQQQELAENLQKLEQQWGQKEQEIARQEEEYKAAAAKVADFESRLQSKIKQGTEEGKGIGAYQGKVKTDLRERETEGEQQNYRLRIESLEQTIRHQATRIGKLSQQLDSSLQQVQNLAVKAIEGTSNRNSFEAMKAIAMEQAKTPHKGK